MLPHIALIFYAKQQERNGGSWVPKNVMRPVQAVAAAREVSSDLVTRMQTASHSPDPVESCMVGCDALWQWSFPVVIINIKYIRKLLANSSVVTRSYRFCIMKSTVTIHVPSSVTDFTNKAFITMWFSKKYIYGFLPQSFLQLLWFEAVLLTTEIKIAICRSELIGLASPTPVNSHAFKFHGNHGLGTKKSWCCLASLLWQNRVQFTLFHITLNRRSNHLKKKNTKPSLFRPKGTFIF